MTARTVDAYLGIGSRYSYLASTQLDRIAAETGATFNWIAVASPDLFAPGTDPFAGQAISGQYDWGYRQADAEAWADYYGVPFREPRGRLSLDPQLLARAAWAAGEPLARAAMIKRLLMAVFVDDRIRLDAEACVDCAAEIGLDAKAFRQALADPATEAHRLAALAQAKQAGVFGVPYFVAGDRHFFGNDRLVLLVHALTTESPAGLRR